MAQFRITRKYAKDIKVTNLATPAVATKPYDNWFIDVIRANRRKIAMITHAHSLLTFLIPYADVGGAKAIPDCIPVLIKQFLWDHDLQRREEAVNRLFEEPPTYCKTADKHIIGHMNDFKKIIDYYTKHSREGYGWDAIAGKINDMISNKYGQGYIQPKEMMIKILGSDNDAKG